MTPTVTARRYRGHNTFYLDGVKMPGPSSLVPKDMKDPAIREAATWIAANIDRLNDTHPDEREQFIKDNALEAWDYARDRGSAAHAVMEALLAGTAATSDDPTVVADATAAVQLMDAIQLTPTHSEIPLINLEWHYAGTADLIAKPGIDLLDKQGNLIVAAGTPVIMDFKFGANTYPSHAVQASAYAHATNSIREVERLGPRGGRLKPVWELDAMPEVSQAWAFLIHAHDGIAELIPVKIDGWVWDAALIHLDAYWEWEIRTGWNHRTKDTFDNPLGDPLPVVPAPPF